MAAQTIPKARADTACKPTSCRWCNWNPGPCLRDFYWGVVQEAQQESLETSVVKDWAAILIPSAIVK
jgi:hypothetical protein